MPRAPHTAYNIDILYKRTYIKEFTCILHTDILVVTLLGRIQPSAKEFGGF